MFLKSILVPLDGSPLSERALPHATELARAARASLTLVRTAEVQPSLPLPHLRPEDPWRYLHVHADLLRRRGLVVDTAAEAGKAPLAAGSANGRRPPDPVGLETHRRPGLHAPVDGSPTHAGISHARRPRLPVVRRRAGSAGDRGGPHWSADRSYP